ncbi:hypothetical protein GCM10028791_23320 [Echinicola sediminis]
MRSFNYKSWPLALFVLLLLASCDNEVSKEMGGTARVNVSLIDAPAEYDAFWVEVLGVEILTKGEDESDDSAWISIPHDSDEHHLNLLSLVGGNHASIGSREIPAGEISQIRLLLGEDNFLVIDGEEIPLKTPSAQQSGLKLKLNQELMAGIQYDLVIDFDAAKSIVKAGNSGQYILKPVLRVVAEESASLEGQVLPVDADPIVYGIINEDTVSTFTDESGAFALRGLISGEYTLIIDPNENYEGDTIYNILTKKGDITILEPIELEMKSDLEVEVD